MQTLTVPNSVPPGGEAAATGRQALPCVAAGFGGTATSLFALAISLTKGEALPNPSFLLGIALLAFLGAMVAVLLDETNCKKAFFLGLGLPSLVQVGAANATRPAAEGAHSAWLALLPVAHASDDEASILGRTLVLRTDGRTAYDVIFTSGDGKREEKVAVPAAATEKNLAVPHYARRYVVQVGRARSASQPLSLNGGGETIVKVTLRDKTWSGLQRAVGIQPSADYDVMVEPQSR